jgi:hypothetical protein
VFEKGAEVVLFKKVSTGNLSIGNIRLSIMSKTSAPGMTGHRVLGIKVGKWQAAIDYHNWPMRSAKDLAKGYGPINQKFWHYHLGKGNAGAVHRQFGTKQPITQSAQLRPSWYGYH